MTQPPRPSSGSPILHWCARLWDYVVSLRPIAGPGILLRSSRNGTVISIAPPRPGTGGGTSLRGAFYTRYTDDDGHLRLQGGTVTGGNGGTNTIADYKLSDATTGPVAAAGQILYLNAGCTATLADGIMLPGCLLTSASLTVPASVPASHTFTVAAPTGSIYLEIGRWTDNGFQPSAGPGNLLASGCIGNFSISRV